MNHPRAPRRPRVRPAAPARAAVLAACLFAAACSGIVDEAPPVQDSLFVEALVDLHLAEARMEAELAPTSATRADLLARHGLDAAAYEAAAAYYGERPEAYYALYTRVLARLHEEAQVAPEEDSFSTPAPSEP